jgi:hypothetical protein
MIVEGGTDVHKFLFLFKIVCSFKFCETGIDKNVVWDWGGHSRNSDNLQIVNETGFVNDPLSQQFFLVKLNSGLTYSDLSFV